MDNPMVMMLVFFVVMMIPMWLMGRSQRKRMRQQQDLVRTLAVGDEVRTHSGFYGMIVEEIGDNLVMLETEDGSQLKWARQAIAERVESFGEQANNDSSAGASDANSGSIAGVTVDSDSDAGKGLS